MINNHTINNQKTQFLQRNLEKTPDLIEKNECHFWIIGVKYP